MPDALLGVDVGTSAMKAVLFAADGTELAATQRSYGLWTPRPGWVEADAEHLWETLLDVLRTIVHAAGADTHIVALALAVPAGSMVPVDSKGTPVAPMITWLDRRAEALVADWQADGTAQQIRQHSGWRPQTGLPLTAIAWLVRNDPAVTTRTARFAGVHDYLTHRLTGHPVTDLSAGAETLLVDQATGAWSNYLCGVAGIRPDQLPHLAPAGASIGPLLPAICQATGLAAATTLIVGGHDQCCAALGMGVTQIGQVMLAAGTAWVITALTRALPIDQIPDDMDLNFHVVPAVRTISQLLGGFGATVEWWLSIAWSPTVGTDTATQADLYAALDRTLADSAAGAHDLIFLPLGVRSGFTGMRLDHTRADLARAILEGVAFEVRGALEKLASAGVPVDRLWLSGGATRSPLWPGILASVTGKPLWLADNRTWPARGAALLAGLGAGMFGSLEEAVDQWRMPLQVIQPDMTTRDLYTARYHAYRQLSEP